jgi:hypothetical protein
MGRHAAQLLRFSQLLLLIGVQRRRRDKGQVQDGCAGGGTGPQEGIIYTYRVSAGFDVPSAVVPVCRLHGQCVFGSRMQRVIRGRNAEDLADVSVSFP